MVWFLLLILAALVSPASANIFRGSESLMFIPLMVVVPVIIGVIVMVTCGKRCQCCKTAREKIEEQIIIGVPVVVFIEEGRESIMSTENGSFYMSGSTPVAELADVYESQAATRATRPPMPTTPTQPQSPPSCSAA
ncbi:hypothetical protein THRCLA_22721 [Thraustotheca clavata]|uniref:Secreted protein n=1 Tax=Thraustotheca clavata TaxID=74557 RepID=A0A1V9YUK1_9STRA|nr:hypothetical protein THRCLA_22721 [Thraustotheca clavata]